MKALMFTLKKMMSLSSSIDSDLLEKEFRIGGYQVPTPHLSSSPFMRF